MAGDDQPQGGGGLTPGEQARRHFGTAKQRVTTLRANFDAKAVDPDAKRRLAYLVSSETKLRRARSELVRTFEELSSVVNEAAYNNSLLDLQQYEQTLDDWEERISRDRMGLESLIAEEADTTQVSNFTTALQNTSGKLPQLQIASFDGTDLSQVQSFLDQFRANVHQRKDLSAVQKMSYLLSFLKGDARETVKGIPLTNDGYKIAMKAFVERYGRKRLTVTTLIRELMEKPSAKGKRELQEMLTYMQAVKRLLDSISADFQSDGANLLLLTIFETKLPYHTREEYEIEVARSEKGSDPEQFNVLFKLPDFFDFLQQRVQADLLMRRSKAKAKDKEDKGHGDASGSSGDAKKDKAKKEKEKTVSLAGTTGTSGGAGKKGKEAKKKDSGGSASMQKGDEKGASGEQEGEKPKITCWICKASDHVTPKCKEGPKLGAVALWNRVRFKVCYTCLLPFNSPGHPTLQEGCNQPKCHCGEPHHKWLHVERDGGGGGSGGGSKKD